MTKVRETKLEVNIKNIVSNINEIQNTIGNEVELMPIIKNNAYGTEINKRIDIFDKANINIVGVAIVDEAIGLREQGFKKDIFILNQPLEEEIPAIAKYNLTVGVSTDRFIEQLGKTDHKYKIHIEICTGMGRTGINPCKIYEYIKYIKQYSNIEIEGIYTHFSCSDCNKEFTENQIKLFDQTVEIAKRQIPNIKYVHASNSSAILNFKHARYNLVRPGILIYGYYPTEDLKHKINVKPSLILKSKISFIKEVDKGFSIGYGRTYITNKKMKIATVPIGYADGIRRSLSNKGNVIINNTVAPIVGTICMDCFMIDVTDILNVNLSDTVYIWDNNKICIEDIAKIYDSINYEVISTISPRVRREFIE